MKELIPRRTRDGRDQRDRNGAQGILGVGRSLALPPVAIVTAEDVRATASACHGALLPFADADWDWRVTLNGPVVRPLLTSWQRSCSYAINLATRSTELRFSGQADPSFSIPERLDALEGRPQFLPWYARRPRPTLAGRTTRPMPRPSSSSPQRSGRSRRVHSRRYAPRRPRRVAPCTRSCRVRRSRADRRWSPPRTR